jgi:hypothetical protein
VAACLVCFQLDLFTHGAPALNARGPSLLVRSQLDLFTHGARALNARGPSLWKMSDRERDRRTGGQWLRAVKAYLEFGAGSAWRRLSDPEQRNSPVRDWYLGGIRTLNGIPARGPLAQDGVEAKAAAPPRASSSPVARLMATRSRGWIVDELLRVNPALTDKKLLLRLSHLKLSGMLVTARRGVSPAAGYPLGAAGKKEGRRILPKPPKRVVPPQSFPVLMRGAA